MGLLLPFLILSPQKVAQAGSCISGSTSIVEGLVTTPALQNDISTSGQNCVIASSAPVSLSDAKIAKVQDYTNFKTLYFNQSKLPSSGPSQQKYTVSGDQTDYFTSTNIQRESIYNIQANSTTPGNLTFTKDIQVSAASAKTIVVYVDGDLKFNFAGTFIYGNLSSSAGIVFVVNGNIDIGQNVTEVDAVLISNKTICTTYDFSSNQCPTTNVLTNGLTIKGSLISLNSIYPIQFKRKLANNDLAPAEEIDAQAKYLVILKDILSSDLLIPIQSQ